MATRTEFSRAWRKLLNDPSSMIGMAILSLLVIAAIFAPLLATHPNDIWDIHTERRLLPPGAEHYFGTDRLGSDIYSRTLFGARSTMLVALVAISAALAIGVPIGLIAGWFGGVAGALIMRISDIFLAVPQIVLAIAIAQMLGPSLENVILALSATYWPWFTRLVYAEVRSVKNEIFVEALVGLGASTWRILALHVLPNVMSPIIIRTSIGMGYTILTAATLSFLGLGAQPPEPEWGRMISEAREFLPEAWWYAAAPGLAIFFVVIGFNLLGDGLRDVLDPRLRRSVGQ